MRRIVLVVIVAVVGLLVAGGEAPAQYMPRAGGGYGWGPAVPNSLGSPGGGWAGYTPHYGVNWYESPYGTPYAMPYGAGNGYGWGSNYNPRYLGSFGRYSPSPSLHRGW
jgi:hypothetical protein